MIGRLCVCAVLALSPMLGARSSSVANALERHDRVSHVAPVRVRERLADDLARLLEQARPTLAHSMAGNVRRRVTRISNRTLPLIRRGHMCAAVRSLDSAVALLGAPSSYRGHRKTVPARASAVAHKFRRLEARIAGAPGSCAVMSSTVHSRALDPLPAHVPPSSTGEHDQDARAYAIPRLRPGAQRFKAPGAPTPVSPPPLQQRLAGPASTTGPNDPMQIYTRTDLGPAGTPFPEENQAASGRDGVVVYTGNTDAFFSVDDGRSFTEMSPATVFGRAPSGICCDQVVRYSPAVDRFFWLMQGTCPAAAANCRFADRYRLAVASSAAIRSAAPRGGPAVEQVWRVYDLPRSLFRETSTSYDLPDMGVGATQLYLVWDRVGAGSLALRMNLGQLARGGTANVLSWRGYAESWRVVQQSGANGMWVHNREYADQSTLEYARDGSDLMFHIDLPHTSFPTADYASPLPNGDPDWNSRVNNFPGQVQGATLQGHRLWVVWAAGRRYSDSSTNAFAQPHLQYAVYDASPLFSDVPIPGSLRRVEEGNFWNDSVAFDYASLASNPRGDVAITFSEGGPGLMPRPVVGFLTGPPALQAFTAADVVARIPAVDRSQGDYSTIQPDGADANRFVTGGYVARSDATGPTDHWVFVRVGRAPPLPPPHVEISAPTNGSSFPSDQTITYHGSAVDYTGNPVDERSLTWTEGTTLLGRGTTLTHNSALGDHTITLTAVDSGGRKAFASVLVHITPPAGNPSVVITSPIDGMNYPYGATNAISFFARFAGPLPLSTSQWTDDYVDAAGRAHHDLLGSGLGLTHTLYYNGTSPTQHTITFTAADAAGRSATDHVRITVGTYG